MVTEEQVLDSMRGIIDPDLGKDIVSLGFIKQLKIDDDSVSFTVELTTPACPVKEQFKTDCETAVSALPGISTVNVTMSAMPSKKQEGSGINTLNRFRERNVDVDRRRRNRRSGHRVPRQHRRRCDIDDDGKDDVIDESRVQA